LNAPEECLKCVVQTAQGLLHRRKVQPSGVLIKLANCLQLVRLMSIGNTLASLFPGQATFSQGIIVQPAMNRQDARQCLPLGGVGVKAVAVREQHLVTALLFVKITLNLTIQLVAR
jgi:hypothetical protein